MTKQKAGSTPLHAEAIRVTGTVQGVGFRPTVWRLAHAHDLRGAVWNDAEGVLIHAWGEPASLDDFVRALRSESPPLARIDHIERLRLEPVVPPHSFEIRVSREGRVGTDVAADAATCPECLTEVLSAVNRRYRYPFTNCTHCGPRLSIVRAIPYDRSNTSMSGFPMCSACAEEYADPADRRFHAQPNACADCGPRVWLEDVNGDRLLEINADDPIQQAGRLLREGAILAVKGIGGVHLACDAGNSEVVQRLRQSKHRYGKPFALMARDLSMVQEYAKADPTERALLLDPAAPVVILNRAGQRELAPGVAPDQNTLGFMLPYTPLHHLLMQCLERPLVLTSGNRSDEPQCTGNGESRSRLGSIVDCLLLHDRPIVNRLDDSVLRVVLGRPRMLRRARGYAPGPIALPAGFESAPSVLAMGGELKNTFCLLYGKRAILSQHIGDLEEAATFRDYSKNLSLFRRLFDHQAQVIAVDLHPDYLSTQLGRELAVSEGAALSEVQHHHAHIAACMAEHGAPIDTGAVLGIALDGLGFGADGSLWGGEFLRADYCRAQRLAAFEKIAMPGGVQAIREPWRNTYAHLKTALGWEQVRARYPRLEIVRTLERKPLSTLNRMMDRGLNSPGASSAGRLCDAVAAALGLCTEGVSFEGQAAIELESVATARFVAERSNAYPFTTERVAGLEVIRWSSMWQALLQDLAAGTGIAQISARFHQGLAAAISAMAMKLAGEQGLRRVVLSGGVFQNRLLLEGVCERLDGQGLDLWLPEKVPANDGGLSLGQAAIAAARWLQD